MTLLLVYVLIGEVIGYLVLLDGIDLLLVVILSVGQVGLIVREEGGVGECHTLVILLIRMDDTLLYDR